MKLHSNPKQDKLKHVLDDREVDVFGFNKHRNNLKHKDCRRHGITQLFDGGESLVRGLWCSNEQEKLNKFISTRTREGGTGMLAFGEMASLISVNGFGKDETGLARWTYLEVTGKEGMTTVFLVGYCPCKNFEAHPTSNKEDTSLDEMEEKSVLMGCSFRTFASYSRNSEVKGNAWW